MLGVLVCMDVVMGMFSKFFVFVGGFIVGDWFVVDYIWYNGLGYVFFVSLLLVVVVVIYVVLCVSWCEFDWWVWVLVVVEYMVIGLVW